MRTICLLAMLGIVIYASAVFAGVPEKISFQGYVTDLSQNPISGEHLMGFKIYDSQSGGNLLWSDSYTLQLMNGQFHAYLGENTALPAGIFTGQVLWLETWIDGSALPARQPLVSVAYSFHAQKADSAQVAFHSQKADSAQVAFQVAQETDPQVGINSPGYVPKWDGSALVSGTIFDNGNVGIGTTNPGGWKLNVAGGDNSLAWGGDHSGSGYARIGRLQFCWGQTHASSDGGVDITFPVPFANTNYRVTFCDYNPVPLLGGFVCGGLIKTAVRYTGWLWIWVELPAPLPGDLSRGSGTVDWIAIGEW